jgi:hypothetical protein
MPLAGVHALQHDQQAVGPGRVQLLLQLAQLLVQLGGALGALGLGEPAVPGGVDLGELDLGARLDPHAVRHAASFACYLCVARWLALI